MKLAKTLLAALLALPAALAFAWDAADYRSSAADGDRVAQYNLGVCYERGYGVDKDLDSAYTWYKKSAKQDYDVAQYRFALFCLNGWGASSDPETAVEYAKKAAAAGNASAACLLGKLLWQGAKGVEKNIPEAASHASFAASKGNAEAQFILFQMMEEKSVEAKEPGEALAWLEKSAGQSYAPAQEELGVRLLSAPNAEAQFPRAKGLLETAARNGSVKAKAALGKALCFGAGKVPPNRKEAIIWIEAAANDGDASMMRLAAEFHMASKDSESQGKALEWLRRSAAAGDAKSKLDLARMNSAGSPEEALQLYYDAYRAGSVEAEYEYAVRLAAGKGAEANPQKAASLLEDAFVKGYEKAALPLMHLCLDGGSGISFPKDVKPLFEKAAAQEASGAWLYCLAEMQLKGAAGLPADEAKAEALYERAWKAGMKEASAPLGFAALKRKDYAKAAPLLKVASDMGNAESMYQYAKLLAAGQGVKADKKLAAEMIAKASDGGLAEAKKDYAKALLSGKELPRNPKAAFDILGEFAAKGDAEAQSLCASLLLKGDGVEQDNAAALELLRKAAASGSLEAQLLCAKILKSGLPNVKADPKAAFAFFCKAADAGDKQGLLGKGVCLIEGSGVEAEPEAGFMCVLKAAEAGEPAAMQRLASAYLKGEGTLRDAPKCFEWNLKAADAGVKECYLPVAIAYSTGKGAAKSAPDAFTWFTRASVSGDPKSLYYLGCCYLRGVGTEANEAKAKELFERALKAAPEDKEIAAAIKKAYAENVKAKEKNAAAKQPVKN